MLRKFYFIFIMKLCNDGFIELYAEKLVNISDEAPFCLGNLYKYSDSPYTIFQAISCTAEMFSKMTFTRMSSLSA